jgi:hypothetical protein
MSTNNNISFYIKDGQDSGFASCLFVLSLLLASFSSLVEKQLFQYTPRLSHAAPESTSTMLKAEKNHTLSTAFYHTLS